MVTLNGPELGILYLVLVPERRCLFPASPARSLRAAVLRRLELLDPGITEAMHDSPEGASSIERPWTVSPLLGPLDQEPNGLAARPGQPYRTRLTSLVPRAAEVLNAAFLSDHPLAQEPLILEHVPFFLAVAKTGWYGLTSYASLLTCARPGRSIKLAFRSPTGFRRRDDRFVEPTPLTCLQGYLRKWNNLASVSLPRDDLLEYTTDHMRVVRQELRPKFVQFMRYRVPGVVGQVEWESDGESPALLRLVNALVDYAEFCGTGIQTTQGMGQTVRLRG